MSEAPGAADRTVAIVITRDRPETLLTCLRHLEGLVTPCAEVVVVDDASTDDTRTAVKARFPSVHLVSTDVRLGPARARNLGLQYARRHLDFRQVLFLDDDAFVQPRCLVELVAAAGTGPGVAIAAPKVYASLAERRLQAAGELRANLYAGTVTDVGGGELDRGQHDRPRMISACSGCAMLIMRDVLDELGGFDEAFAAPAWEDLDLCLRARRLGYGIVYAPRAVVEHRGGRRARGLRLDRERAKASNWILLLREHATPLQWTCFLVLLPFRALGLAIQRLVAGEPAATAQHVRGAVQGMRRLGGPRAE